MIRKTTPGRDKNRLCDPICLRVGGLAAPAGTNMCPCGFRMQKKSKAGPPEPTNWSKTLKNKEKPAWKVPRRHPALKKSARALCEAAKTQGNIIDERRAPPKTGDGPQKNTRGATNDILHENKGTHQIQESVRAHCPQMRGLPLSFIPPLMF